MPARNPRAAALRMMLEMLVKHRRERAAAPSDLGDIDVTKLSVSRLLEMPLKTRWADHLDHAKEDTVEAALYAVIREEGWRAYAAGGLDGMHVLSDDATKDDDRLASILDHRWDGIGVEGRGVWVT